MLAPVRVTPPSLPPVSLEEAKAHLRVDHDEDDATIAAYVEAAASHLDGWSGILGRCLVTQVWRIDLCGFPRCRFIRLPLSPVQSVSEVTYYDADGVQQTLPPAVYGLHADGAGPFVALNVGQSWPATDGRENAVSVTFTAGYGAPDAVPQAIRQAILLLVGHWYLNREDVAVGLSVTEMPKASTALLAPFRRLSV